MTEQLTKDKSRQRWSELRDLLNKWDFIGAVQDGRQTEYDCLIAPLMRRLESGQSSEDLAQFLGQQIPDHFGLDEVLGIVEFSSKVKTWFDTTWSGTAV
jgi:hypothetical protein